MNWQLIAMAGFVVFIALFVAAIFVYSNLHSQHNEARTALRLRSNREEDRSIRGADCRG
jgi:hypothetical protein